MPAHRGRHLEASMWRSGVRRPRVGLANRLPGGAGAAPGDTRTPCQELADGRRAKLPRRTKSAARRRSENAAVERREASGLRHWPQHASQRAELQEAPSRRSAALAWRGKARQAIPAPAEIRAMTFARNRW